MRTAAMLGISVVVVLIAGCGRRGTAGAPCLIIDGEYRATFVETSGNCGAQAPRNFFLTSDIAPPALVVGWDCTGSETLSTDGCNLDYDYACDFQDSEGFYAGTVRVTGSSTIVSQTEMVGSFSEIADGPAPGFACNSTYDVTFTLL